MVKRPMGRAWGALRAQLPPEIGGQRNRLATWGLFLVVLALSSCYGPTSRRRCSRQGDCDPGFCSAAGFCWQECQANRDCPCDSYCETTCGVCLRGDNNKAATCFSHDRGLTDEDVAGACRGMVPLASDPVSTAACQLPVPTCSIFIPQPSEDAVVDASSTADAADDTAAADGDEGAPEGGQP